MTQNLLQYRVTLFLCTILLLSACNSSFAQDDDVIKLTEGLAIERLGRSGRTPMRIDPVEHQIVSGAWEIPSVSDTVTHGDDTEEWGMIESDEEGWFRGRALRGGYIHITYTADEAQTKLLHARGHSMVYVNGEPRYGDPYNYGYSKLPIQLNGGKNSLLFQCSRGRLKADLLPAQSAEYNSSILLNDGDLTLPDFIAGEAEELWGGIIVINASDRPTGTGLTLMAETGDKATFVKVPRIMAHSTRKVPFKIAPPSESDQETIEVKVTLLLGRDNIPQDQTTFEMKIRQPGQSYKRTFISGIDGSVQYYAVQPANPVDDRPLALFLSLHGASVEAINQANAYSSKRWGHLVAPTNRRPYGFDWEDWGRLDAMEVLNIARAEYKLDPHQTYLTGHSMGGHGTWQVGVTFPDQFAAIGPSAGWESFWSYSSAPDLESEDSVEALLHRAAASSDTLGMATNYLHHGVYILHGDDDRTVPVSEARKMRDTLKTFHNRVAWYEEPGAGHWWDASDEPGADCVDWAPMFDFFSKMRIPAHDEVRQVTFVTVNPAVSSQSYWLEIISQHEAMKASVADIQFDPHKRRFFGKTENIHRLKLSLGHVQPGEDISVQLDGAELSTPWPDNGMILLERNEGEWQTADAFPARHKGAQRSGPFKQAFKNHFMFVYGTQGSDEETQWAQNKARYDAEQFWYRGNGAVDVIADTEFNADEYPDRDVILYGNADINGAWNDLLADAPIKVKRDSIVTGAHEYSGDDLACVFLYPRPDSDSASVGVVAGTGLEGLRLTGRFPYFVSGVAYPDWFVVDSSYLLDGTEGVLSAGFFEYDWSLPHTGAHF